MNEENQANESSGWSGLYKVGGVSAILMAVFIPIQIAVFVTTPPPSTVLGWFELFARNKFLGLMDMDLLLVVDQIFMILIFLTLYVALKRFSQSLMTIALTLGLSGAVIYFASATAFEMLNLSNQYAAATSEPQRAVLLSAGQTMLATWQGTAFDVGYVLAGIALLLAAVVMWRSNYFGKTTAYIALVLGAMSLLPPTAGKIGMFFALGSLIPLELWAILIGRKFFQLSKTQ